MVKEIPLTKGYVALVDDEDYERVAQFRWCVHIVPMKSGHLLYAKRNAPDPEGSRKRVYIYMHRFLMPDAKSVDHRDGNGLNNTRSNLREATSSQNNANKSKYRGRLSRYKGVTRNKGQASWIAQMTYGGRNIHLGCFSTEVEAAIAYDRAALERFGEFARINFPIRGDDKQ